MLTIYGSKICPDCVACKSSLDANGIAYDFIDITDSMQNLKKFLRLRDAENVFEDARANGYVGIPALIPEDGSITLDWGKYLSEKGIETAPKAEYGAACRLDGTGC